MKSYDVEGKVAEWKMNVWTLKLCEYVVLIARLTSCGVKAQQTPPRVEMWQHYIL